MSAIIIQGLGRPKSAPCLPSERHASTNSSRLTTNTQLPRLSFSWTSTDSNISTSSSTFQVLRQAANPTIEGNQEHDLSWYRNIEDWDFENKMVKIGPPLSRQRQKHDSLQSEAAEQTSRAEEEKAEQTAQATQKKHDSMKAILTQLCEQADCISELEELPKGVTEPVSVSLLSTQIRDLQQIVSQHDKQGEPIPAANLSQELNHLQRLILTFENHLRTETAKEDDLRVSLLREAIHALVHDFENLIDPHRTCIVCGCRSKVDTYASKTTSQCTHETNTCSPCLQMWVEAQIATKTLKIKCVECPSLLSYTDIQSCITTEIFEKYDKLAARTAMISLPDFRWCLNPTCSSGQEHTHGARFTCHACHHQYCTKHGTSWHQNETCDQYDTRWIAARIQDQASEEWKAVQTRTCPKCKALIEKDGGCDHMGCTAPGCNHQFNWSGAEGYEAQDFVVPPISMKASIAVPSDDHSGRRFKISRVFRMMFFRGRGVQDVC